MATEKQYELINKWDVVNKLIQLENNYQFYKEQWDADVLYRRICELEVGIGKTTPVDAVALPCKIGDAAWGIRCYRGVLVPQQGKVSEMLFTADMKLSIVIKHICRGEWARKCLLPERKLRGRLQKGDPMKKFKRYLLLFLMVLVAVEGFSFVYLKISFLLGLPSEWWVGMITTVLGGLSTWGLFTWIERVLPHA